MARAAEDAGVSDTDVAATIVVVAANMELFDPVAEGTSNSLRCHHLLV